METFAISRYTEYVAQKYKDAIIVFDDDMGNDIILHERPMMAEMKWHLLHTVFSFNDSDPAVPQSHFTLMAEFLTTAFITYTTHTYLTNYLIFDSHIYPQDGG